MSNRLTASGLEYVCSLFIYLKDKKATILIFRCSFFEEESTALYDMRSFQNPKLVDQYYCLCCVEPKKTLVTRFKYRNFIQITETSSKRNIALNLE